MPDCIFCKIAKGDIPSVKVHEDEHSFAFLDIDPLTVGHTLVIPKKHYDRLEAMPQTESNRLWATIARLVPAVQEGAGATSSNIAFNNGPEAGQEVAHVHCHVIPRRKGDGGGPVHAIIPQAARPKVTKDELAKTGEAIRTNIR
ncbi:MAG: HIT family protein [Euryarchaeota archaeon]|nr:HIT family protein [Euryarchaeota archaeon]